MSILDNSEELSRRVNEVAEVAGYLWQKGWAERNGGNIVINITDCVDEEIRRLPSLGERLAIGTTLPHLQDCYFYCKGTNRRMRDLAREPMANGSVIRITDDCAHYEIIADQAVRPTSELPSHLSVHDYLIAKGSNYKASLHTHSASMVEIFIVTSSSTSSSMRTVSREVSITTLFRAARRRKATPSP